MKMSRFFSALLALIILACSFGVQGQYTTSQSQTTSIVSSSNGTSSSVNSQYTQSNSQYYGIPSGYASAVHIGASVPYDINAKTPTNVYLGSKNQAVPYAQYMSSSNGGVNTLWIQGATNWTQYTTVPQGTTVTLIAITSAGGKGYLDEIANGMMYNFDQTFYPSSQLTFYADTVGQHTLYFMLNGQPSNKVIIGVTGTINYEPPYYPYQYYYPGDYQDYYPGYYSGYYPRYYRDYSSQGYSFQYSSY